MTAIPIPPKSLHLLALCSFGLAMGPSCQLLMPKKGAPPPAAQKQASRTKYCELAPGAERLQFMPYGHYTATWSNGTGKLELMEDQKFHLSYVNDINGMQTQWNGLFEWKKAGIGETLNLCEVRKATWTGANGTSPRVEPGSSMTSIAVMGINRSSHQFRVSLDGVDIAFRLKGS